MRSSLGAACCLGQTGAVSPAGMPSWGHRHLFLQEVLPGPPTEHWISPTLLLPTGHPLSRLRLSGRLRDRPLAAQQATLTVTHRLADGLSRFLTGRQCPWSNRNARTQPRQTWASLSRDNRPADSTAGRRVSTAPHPASCSIWHPQASSPAGPVLLPVGLGVVGDRAGCSVPGCRSLGAHTASS